jgi:hypothetical protein
MNTKKYLLDALAEHYRGQIAKHRANLTVPARILENPVGLAEHPDIIETLDDQVGKLAEYDEKLEMLTKHFYVQRIEVLPSDYR